MTVDKPVDACRHGITAKEKKTESNNNNSNNNNNNKNNRKKNRLQKEYMFYFKHFYGCKVAKKEKMVN